MKYNVYKREIEIIKAHGTWTVFMLGSDGKKRVSHDIFIPSTVSEENMETYLEDLLHEWASPGNDKICKID